VCVCVWVGVWGVYGGGQGAVSLSAGRAHLRAPVLCEGGAAGTGSHTVRCTLCPLRLRALQHAQSAACSQHPHHPTHTHPHKHTTTTPPEPSWKPRTAVRKHSHTPAPPHWTPAQVWQRHLAPHARAPAAQDGDALRDGAAVRGGGGGLCGGHAAAGAVSAVIRVAAMQRQVL
jgi:hypothetical protein